MLPRSVVIASLAFAAFASASWNSVQFRTVDIGGKPYPKAQVRFSYRTLDGTSSGTWTTADSGLTVKWDGGGAEFDSIWDIRVVDTTHDTFWFPETIRAAQVDAKTTGVNDLDSRYDFRQTLKLDYKWVPSPLASDSGFADLPGVPYQILYDPPGDGSFASLAQDTSFQTTVKTSFGYGAGGSLSLGYSYEAPFGIASADVEVSASVDYKHNTEDEFTATVHSGSSIQTSPTADAKTTGPGRGDLFVVPALRVKWHLYRAYHPADSNAFTDGYVYKMFYRPVRDTSSSLLRLTASAVQDMFANHPAALAQILGSSVIDPATRRIRTSLVDPVTHLPRSGRLTQISSSWESLSGGGASTSNSFSKEVTQTNTVSYDLDIGAEASAKVKVGGVSVGATIKANVTTGKTSSTAHTYDRAFSETIVDADSWDFLRYRIYLDNAYGVYVFDVDSASSWTSLPWETGYSRPSIDWRVKADHDTLAVAPGESAVFRISVQNRNRPDIAAVDSIQSVQVSVGQNSGSNVSVDPVNFPSILGLDRTVTATVSAVAEGTYPVTILLSGSISNGVSSSTPLNQSVPLVLVVKPSLSVADATTKPALRRAGNRLSVSVPEGSSWTLRTHDLQGRLVQEVSGVGSGTRELPALRGAAIVELSSPAGGQRIFVAGF